MIGEADIRIENVRLYKKGDVRWVCPVVFWYYARYTGCALDARFDDLSQRPLNT